MDYWVYFVLGIILFLLIFAGIWWSADLLPFSVNTDLNIYKDKLAEIAQKAGFKDEIRSYIRIGSTFHTADRTYIYIALHDDRKKPIPCNEIIRQGIHQIAHKLNRDSCEHGSMFTAIETKLYQVAVELGYDIELVGLDECNQHEAASEVSEGLATKKRLLYSFSYPSDE